MTTTYTTPHMHRISSRNPMSASSSSAAGDAPPSAAAATSSAGSTPAAASSSSSSSSLATAAANPKKTKASTSSSPSTAPAPWLLLIPDVTRDVMYSYLKKNDVSYLSVGSKCLLDEYGNRCESLLLYRRQSDNRTLSSLLGFTERQRHLTKVGISSDKYLPPFFISLGAGCFSHLQVLELHYIRLLASISSTIAAMIAKDTLPMLEELNVHCKLSEQTAVKALLQGLREGACPCLHALDLPYTFHAYTVDEGGAWNVEDEPNEEETELNLAALADLLEERQRLGTCQAVKNIGYDWLNHGSEETQARLLRLFLPLVEYLPELGSDFSWGMQHAQVFREVPAPYLEQLDIPSNAHPPLLDSLVSMTSLKDLTFLNGAFDRASFERFISLITEHKDNTSFLPNLCDLYLSAAVQNHENGDLGFSRLFRALEGTACAKGLKILSITRCGMSTDGSNALATLIENGGLPSLRYLRLEGNGIGNAGVIQLLTSCKAAGPALLLEDLHISREGMNDESLRAFASALETGPLRRLNSLTFSHHEDITDAGIMHLIKAINNDSLAEITQLALLGTKMTSKCAGTLAAAVLMHCPKISCFLLPASKIHKDARLAIKGFFRNGRHVYVHFE